MRIDERQRVEVFEGIARLGVVPEETNTGLHMSLQVAKAVVV